MDDFGYTHTRTYTSKRIYKTTSPILRSQAVRNFLNRLYSVLFFFNLGKKKQFPPSRKHPLPTISSPFSCLNETGWNY